MDTSAVKTAQGATVQPEPNPVLRSLGKSRSRWWRLGIFLALLLGAGLAYFFLRGDKPQEEQTQWRTAALDIGDIVTIASATGDLKPQRVIKVGAEISGRIETVSVEINDSVKKGQVLATFDTKSLQNSLEEAEASLDAVRADIVRARATRAEALSNESRTQSLADKGATSTKDLEAAKAASKRASADLQSILAQERLSKARLETAKANLAKAAITAPIDGVVLSRNIEPGNTVASSFQAPELFVIAEDLRRMELHVAVDEADVGRVKAGQSATFTVAAWPEEVFSAKVSKVYLSSSTTNNVVTYTVVLEVDNTQGLLRPGMTATATITTGTESDVLRVPNRALRFTPEPEDEGGFRFGPPMQAKQHSTSDGVWVLRNGTPTHVPVVIGATDGRYTAIKSDTLKAGDLVLVGMEGGSI